MYEIAIERLPSPELSPNWRGHWRSFHKAMQLDKREMEAYCLHQCGRLAEPLQSVSAKVDVFLKSKRRMDHDNFSARMKGFWDGLVSAGLLADDSTDVIKSVQYSFQTDREQAGPFGKVVFQIQETA